MLMRAPPARAGSSTGALQFHFDGGKFNDAAEFTTYLDALNALREMAKSLPANPEPAKA